MIIDAHQHFWKFDPVRDGWITEEMNIIRRDFLPEDLAPILEKNKVGGTVAVQADQSHEETKFLLGLAEQHDFIRGVVGWEDLKTGDLEERLKTWKSFPKLKGFRAIIQGQPDEMYLTNKKFQNGVSMLPEFGYTYDILIYHYQFPSAIRFAEKFPDHRLMLDHLGKPPIRDREFKKWREHIRILAQHPGIYCKCSGMVTEADWEKWGEQDLYPYLEIAAEYFGTHRLCFGSDWPVCLVAGNYDAVLGVVRKFFSQVSVAEQEMLLGGNATRFYQLS